MYSPNSTSLSRIFSIARNLASRLHFDANSLNVDLTNTFITTSMDSNSLARTAYLLRGVAMTSSHFSPQFKSSNRGYALPLNFVMGLVKISNVTLDMAGSDGPRGRLRPCFYSTVVSRYTAATVPVITEASRCQ